MEELPFFDDTFPDACKAVSSSSKSSPSTAQAFWVVGLMRLKKGLNSGFVSDVEAEVMVLMVPTHSPARLGLKDKVNSDC